MSTVVITGGSRGIGAAAVKSFAARGDQVYFLYEKNHEAANAVAAETGATPICCDVSDGSAVKNAFAQIGHVDILICVNKVQCNLATGGYLGPAAAAEQSHHYQSQ